MWLLWKLSVTAISAGVIAAGSQAAAADVPKEGSYDITSCWSGTGNAIEFSKAHSAISFEIVGTNRSNTPGGFLDMTSFRCVGLSNVVEGKSSGINFCETIDKDGDKLLVRNIAEGPRNKLETLVGTGKYEGIVRTGVAESAGAFPAVRPGSIQGCNRGTGTYKIR
jgi:hypothetical protein